MGKAAARGEGVLKGGHLRKGQEVKRRWGAFGFTQIRSFVFVYFMCVASSVFSQSLAEFSQKIQSGSTEEKREALFQLRNLRSKDASRAAASALHDKNPMVRATAASSVVFLPRSEAAPALLPLLNDKDEFVRREAAFTLGEVGNSETAAGLMKTMTTDKSQEVRLAAAVALGKLGNPIAVSSLTSILNTAPSEDTEMLRRAAARAIGQIALIMRSDKMLVLTPQNFLPEKFKDVGSRPPADLLAHFRDAVQTLIRVLESSNESDDTRREAAFALGAIGDRTAEAALTKYAASSDVYLAEIVKEALLKLRGVE